MERALLCFLAFLGLLFVLVYKLEACNSSAHARQRTSLMLIAPVEGRPAAVDAIHGPARYARPRQLPRRAPADQ